MWVRLKRIENNEEVLVNLDSVMSIEPAADGKGCKLISIAPNKDVVRVIQVKESVKALREMLGIQA